MSCVDEGHPCIREGGAHDVGGRGFVTLSGCSHGFGPTLSGCAFCVRRLVPGGFLMPCGAVKVFVMSRGIYCVGCALRVQAYSVRGLLSCAVGDEGI